MAIHRGLSHGFSSCSPRFPTKTAIWLGYCRHPIFRHGHKITSFHILFHIFPGFSLHFPNVFSSIVPGCFINCPRISHNFPIFPSFLIIFPEVFHHVFPFLTPSPSWLQGSSPACSLGGGGFGASGVTGGSTLGTAPGAISRRCSKASTMPPAFCSKKLAISTWDFLGELGWTDFMIKWLWSIRNLRWIFWEPWDFEVRRMIYGWIYGGCSGDFFISLLWFDYDLADKNIADITQLNTIGKLAISTWECPQLRNRCHLPSTLIIRCRTTAFPVFSHPNGPTFPPHTVARRQRRSPRCDTSRLFATPEPRCCQFGPGWGEKKMEIRWGFAGDIMEV